MQTLSDAALAAHVAQRAGRVLLDIQATSSLAADAKTLGQAGDAQSNTLILEALHHVHPHDAILSEESVDDPARLEATRVWIVDPLDGTREFGLRGRSDWAVHVALWEAGRGLTAGAVALPALGQVLATDSRETVPVRANGPLRMVVSESRAPDIVHPLAADLEAVLVPMGSAGAKAMAVVRGEADIYVHAGGQWEWDSAAPVAVAKAAGFHTSRLDGSPLLYNQPRPYLPDLVLCRLELADRVLDTLRRLLSSAR